MPYLVATALFALPILPAHAERDPWSGAPIKPDKHRKTPSPITDRFYVRGTFFNPAITTLLRIDTQSPAPGVPGITGTTVNGERDLGLDSRIPQGRIEIMFRRHCPNQAVVLLKPCRTDPFIHGVNWIARSQGETSEARGQREQQAKDQFEEESNHRI